MKKNNITAVVVTYNRKEKLLNCIQSLMNQKGGACDILVIDNASTDGTKEALSNFIENGEINYHNTGRNLGGAGGFEIGVRLATDRNYKYLWLMDDDCVPEKNALLELKKAHNRLKGRYGFLSGRVLWKDKTPCAMNIQKASLTAKLSDFDRDLQRIQYATFVSCFIRTAVVKEEALPIGEFFIWGDDIEYTRRISRDYPCYYVEKSIVIHDCASNTGSDISRDSIERLKNYEYAYRNEVYIFKREGLKGLIYWWFRLNLHTFRVLSRSEDHKMKRLFTILKGTGMGLVYSPTIDLA